MGKFDHELSDSFEYLKCCFFEALRIESPVPQSSPTTFYEDVVINGVHINAYDQIGIAIDYMQKDKAQWQKPDEFIPERFDPESPYALTPAGKRRNPYSFAPFLGGQRICIGKTFVEQVSKLTLPTLLANFDFAFPAHIDPDTYKMPANNLACPRAPDVHVLI